MLLPRSLLVGLVGLVALAVGCGGSRAAQRPTPAPAASSASFVEQDVVDEGLVLPGERFGTGDVFTVVEELSIKSVIDMNAADTIRYDNYADTEATIEILEADAQGEVVRSRVTFAIDEVRSILDRKADRESSPIAGKTYLIDHAAEPLGVTDDRGAAPSRSEVAAVRAQLEGDVDKTIDRIYSRHAWRIEQRVELSPDALAVVNRASRDPRTRYTAFAQELRSADNGTASFVITARIEQGTNNGPIVLDLGGTKEVDIGTGRTRSMILRGRVTGYLGGNPVRGEALMSFLIK